MSIKPAISAEVPSRIEPCFIERLSTRTADLVTDLSSEAAQLNAQLHPRTAASLADIVRVMNCYYSNLIEGHNTTPREIEQALAGQLATEDSRRDLQIEARAHIRLQAEIDRLYHAGALPEASSEAFVCWLHREFYRDASQAMLTLEGAGRQFVMEPGMFRSLPEHEVAVGRHVPPASDRVQDFMAYFAERYQLNPLGKAGRIIALASAHHRFNFIHPFPDGNGRVSRLMSHAMGLLAGIGAGGLWSISRGLARGLESRGEYKRMMDHADTPRQGDLDGRGNLSAQALEEYIDWFLRICIDQLKFMRGLFELSELEARLWNYVQHKGYRSEAFPLLRDTLLRGELSRGEAERVTGLKERTAREVLSFLVEDGILASSTPKGAVALNFPLQSVDILFPRLFPIA